MSSNQHFPREKSANGYLYTLLSTISTKTNIFWHNLLVFLPIEQIRQANTFSFQPIIPKK